MAIKKHRRTHGPGKKPANHDATIKKMLAATGFNPKYYKKSLMLFIGCADAISGSYHWWPPYKPGMSKAALASWMKKVYWICKSKKPASMSCSKFFQGVCKKAQGQGKAPPGSRPKPIPPGRRPIPAPGPKPIPQGKRPPGSRPKPIPPGRRPIPAPGPKPIPQGKRPIPAPEPKPIPQGKRPSSQPTLPRPSGWIPNYIRGGRRRRRAERNSRG